MIASHEDRLQRVEDGVRDCAVGISNVRGDVGLIRQSLADGFEKLSYKLDIDADKHDSIDARHEQVLTSLRDLHPRLEALETGRRAREKQLSSLRKAGIGIVLALLGGAAAKFGEMLWDLLK